VPADQSHRNFPDETIRRPFGPAEHVRPSGPVVESRLPSQRPRPSPASGSQGPRRVGGRLPSSPGSNATRSSRPPLGGRPRPNFTCRGFLGGKEAPELSKSSVPLLCEGLPGLTECLPL